MTFFRARATEAERSRNEVSAKARCAGASAARDAKEKRREAAASGDPHLHNQRLDQENDECEEAEKQRLSRSQIIDVLDGAARAEDEEDGGE